MEGYTKLFQCLLASSVWAEDDRTRIVWLTMLALRNSRNEVEASVSGLAHMARVPVEDTRRALSIFLSPDEDSRDKAFEGRRIEEIDGGWRILNGEKYARKLSEEEKKEYFRKKQAEYRAKKKGLPEKGTPLPGERAYVKAMKDGRVGDANAVLNEMDKGNGKSDSINLPVPEGSR